MKSSEYWQRRFDELEAALLRKGERYNASEVERQFKMAMAAIEKEISYWYQRLGSNNGVSAAEARRLLSADELREFHWTVEEYIKYGRTAGFTDKWMKQLENASAKAHISRLDAIKLQIQQQLEVLYGNQVDGLDRLMRDIYTEGYNRSAYTIDKGMGVHYNLASTDSGRIDTIINQPWAGDGKIFSDRLWRDKDKLVNTLQQEMTQAVTRGDKLGDAVKKIASRMNVAKSSAARLVMTESAFISGRSQRDCFKGLGVNKYEYVATLDRKTSEICQEMDGKVFDIDDYKPGTNAPPMHCWCRSCIAPYFDDEEISERAARDPKTGKTVRVPGEMTYRDWKAVHIDNLMTQSEWNKFEKNLIPATDDYIALLAGRYNLTYTKGKKGAERFYSDDGIPIYPPNDGAVGVPRIITIPVGAVLLTRYGREYGRYVSPGKIPFSARALPRTVDKSANNFHMYKVTKEIAEAQSSLIAPWFGEIGGGVQYKLPATVAKLLDGYLIEVSDYEDV